MLFRVGQCIVLLILAVTGTARPASDAVLPSLSSRLICHYDFDHPVAGDADSETDLGLSGTALRLVNGGAAMRVEDSAYPTAGRSLQTQQVNAAANDDWKAGVYNADGVATLDAFNAVGGITLMAWVKPMGPDSIADEFAAAGLAGLLSGTSDGHLVRALLEVIRFDDSVHLVALGRRDDGGDSLLLASDDDWETLAPRNAWTHIAATFNFDDGTIALYRNGDALPASYTSELDQWQLAGDPEPDVSSASNPAGIKVGGSFPQNTQERNPFNGRLDDLMLFDRAVSAIEVEAQFARSWIQRVR
jgi:hypothetical protein